MSLEVLQSKILDAEGRPAFVNQFFSIITQQPVLMSGSRQCCGSGPGSGRIWTFLVGSGRLGPDPDHVP
jgi:hypothetical protein